MSASGCTESMAGRQELDSTCRTARGTRAGCPSSYRSASASASTARRPGSWPRRLRCRRSSRARRRGRARASACSQPAPPKESTTACTPSPPVAARTCRGQSGVVVAEASARSELHAARDLASLPEVTHTSAPSACAICRQNVETPEPPPVIRRRRPGAAPAHVTMARQAVRPASGNAAASSQLSAAGLRLHVGRRNDDALGECPLGRVSRGCRIRPTPRARRRPSGGPGRSRPRRRARRAPPRRRPRQPCRRRPSRASPGWACLAHRHNHQSRRLRAAVTTSTTTSPLPGTGSARSCNSKRGSLPATVRRAARTPHPLTMPGASLQPRRSRAVCRIARGARLRVRPRRVTAGRSRPPRPTPRPGSTAGSSGRYGFNHEEAVRCFERAVEADPACAMAHWGIAYAIGPELQQGLGRVRAGRADRDGRARARRRASGRTSLARRRDPRSSGR